MSNQIKNGEKPINPTLLRQVGENEFRVASEKDSREGIFLKSEIGLTKREYFAAMAMQGFISSKKDFTYNPTDIVHYSIDFADELLKQLDNEQ